MSTNKRFWQNWLQNFAWKYYDIIDNLTEMWHKVRENHGSYFDNWIIMLQISVNRNKLSRYAVKFSVNFVYKEISPVKKYNILMFLNCSF